MSEKEKRINMIKLFAIGIKYANAGISDDDFYYKDLIAELFDTKDGESATVEEIFKRLSDFENVNQVEERKTLSKHISDIRNNNETIELLNKRMGDLKIIK